MDSRKIFSSPCTPKYDASLLCKLKDIHSYRSLPPENSSDEGIDLGTHSQVMRRRLLTDYIACNESSWADRNSLANEPGTAHLQIPGIHTAQEHSYVTLANGQAIRSDFCVNRGNGVEDLAVILPATHYKVLEQLYHHANSYVSVATLAAASDADAMQVHQAVKALETFFTVDNSIRKIIHSAWQKGDVDKIPVKYRLKLAK